jgi:translation initiation factor IF-3
MARELYLDLVYVAGQPPPPVVKIMDFGKYKYEEAQRAKESRRKSTNISIKEMKYRPKIGQGDFDTKTRKVSEFLSDGHKVKITIMFRGREQSRPELGFRLLQRLAADVQDLGFVESAPKQDGRNMIMVLGPHKKKAEAKAERAADKARSQTPRGGVAEDRPAEVPDTAVQA